MGAVSISDLRFLRCDWKVLKPITHIPVFPGILWSSLLRHSYNPFLSPGEKFFNTGLRLTSPDRVEGFYRAGETLQLFLTLPHWEQPRLARVLASLNGLPGLHGQFQPEVTLRLTRIECRLSRRPWPAFPAAEIAQQRIDSAMARFWDLKQFQIIFHGPLRLTMPPQKKLLGRFAKPKFFREDPTAANHLLASCGSTTGGNFEILASCLAWKDVNYGRTTRPKVLGGVRGSLILGGTWSFETASALILRQFLGFGKNRAFGFGSFTLAEIAPHLGIAPLPHRFFIESMIHRNKPLEKKRRRSSASLNPCLVVEKK